MTKRTLQFGFQRVDKGWHRKIITLTFWAFSNPSLLFSYFDAKGNSRRRQLRNLPLISEFHFPTGAAPSFTLAKEWRSILIYLFSKTLSSRRSTYFLIHPILPAASFITCLVSSVAYVLMNLKNLDGSLWLGLFRKAFSSEFIWSDHSLSVYTAWAPKQPNAEKAQNTCVAVNSSNSNAGLWDDIDCAARNRFICKIRKGT